MGTAITVLLLHLFIISYLTLYKILHKIYGELGEALSARSGLEVLVSLVEVVTALMV